MIIYKHTCKTTNESYIGLTKHTIEHRTNGHIAEANRGGGYQFHAAIRKHGWDNFETEILEDNTTTDIAVLKEQEIYWIAFFDTYRNGLNCTKGGDGGQPTPESSAKMVETRRKNGTYITGAKKRLANITPEQFRETAAKTAATRKANNGYAKSIAITREHGIGYFHTCQHCDKEVQGGNFFRWHGDNCKHNPDITEEQIAERNKPNQGIIPSKAKKIEINQNKGLHTLITVI